ncbi:MAG TPA: hypothetical protein VEA16_19855 [Vicinamibacterales bacterium]|nr:hypothetical protein [Vicinamibacterales bacterium]
MFAGLPGIGVGTLFYVLMALWMPLREIPRVMQGTSSLATWKIILRQMFYATGIIVTVMFAERTLLWVLGDSQVQPLSPTTWVHAELGARAEGSLLAAPLTASILMLAGVLLVVEVLRAIVGRLSREPVNAISIGDANRRRATVEEGL